MRMHLPRPPGTCPSWGSARALASPGQLLSPTLGDGVGFTLPWGTGIAEIASMWHRGPCDSMAHSFQHPQGMEGIRPHHLLSPSGMGSPEAESFPPSSPRGEISAVTLSSWTSWWGNFHHFHFLTLVPPNTGTLCPPSWLLGAQG